MVQQHDGLMVNAQLRINDDFKKFVHRTERARERDERIRQPLHQLLALAHRLDINHLRKILRTDHIFRKKIRHDANHFAILLQSGLRHSAHQAQFCASIVNGETLLGAFFSKGGCQTHIFFRCPIGRAAENRDRTKIFHCNGCLRGIRTSEIRM